MYCSQSSIANMECDGKRQSNVPHFDELEVSNGTSTGFSVNGPKQTNASMYVSGRGTLSRGQCSVLGLSAVSTKRSVGFDAREDEGDRVRAVYEEPHRRFVNSERNVDDEKDQWVFDQNIAHPSRKTSHEHGMVCAHQDSVLSTEGSFHLSHLEGDSISEGSDEMDYSDTHAPHESKRTSVGYSQEGILLSETSRDSHHRNRIKPRNSSKFDGLSWQQYKTLATRRKDAHNHTEMMNIEELGGESFGIPAEYWKRSAGVMHDDFEARNEYSFLDERREAFHGLMRQHSLSPPILAATNKFQSQRDQRSHRTNLHPDVWSSTLVDGHHDTSPALIDFDDYDYRPDDLSSGVHQSHHLPGTNRHYDSSSDSQSEKGDDTLGLDELMHSRFASNQNIYKRPTDSTNNTSQLKTVSERTAVDLPKSARELHGNLNPRTNLSYSYIKQDHEELQSVPPDSLEQNQSGAHSYRKGLPISTSSESARDLAAVQKRPWRRKLETVFSKTKESFSERTRLYANPKVNGTIDKQISTGFRRDVTMSTDVQSSEGSSNTACSINNGQGVSSVWLQESDMMITHPGSDLSSHHHHLSGVEAVNISRKSQEPQRGVKTSSLLQSDPGSIHSNQSKRTSDAAKTSKPCGTSSAFSDRFDPVQDLLMSSSALSTTKGPRNEHNTLNSLRTSQATDKRSSNALTTSKGSVLQYSSALPSHPLKSSGKSSKEPSFRVVHPTQHYQYTGSLMLNQQLDEPLTLTRSSPTKHSKKDQDPKTQPYINSEIHNAHHYPYSDSLMLNRQFEEHLILTSSLNESTHRSVSSNISEHDQQLQKPSDLNSKAHHTQHYTGAIITNQELEEHLTLATSLSQSTQRSANSNCLKSDHHSSITTSADGDAPNSSRRDWYPPAGSHLTLSVNGDLKDVHSTKDDLPFFSQGMRSEVMNYHPAEEYNEGLSVNTPTSNFVRKALRARTSKAPYQDRHPEMNCPNSSSPRHATSILWVFKLLDILHNHPLEKHEVLVSQAYWLRRWLSKVRLIKMYRQEEEEKWRRAVTFHNMTLQQKYLGQWLAAVQSRSTSARLLYQHCLLRKGLCAFRFALMSSKVQSKHLETRLKTKTLARYFSKWRTLTQLRKEKEALLDQIANQHVTVKAFTFWKDVYHTQQQMGIADLHYKVELLCKVLDNWKAYIIHRRKRFYQTEIVRLFHEDRLCKRAWVTMATIFAERQKARRQYRWSMLRRSWKAWKHGIQIMKMENLHENARAMVFRDRITLQRFFKDWKERTNVAMMMHKREKAQLRQALMLWRLKHRRRQLLCRILDSKARKSLRRRAFTAWREQAKRSIEARSQAVRLIDRVQMGIIISKWRSWTCIQISHRKILYKQLSVHNKVLLNQTFRDWKLSWLRERALHQGLTRWSEGCVQRAVLRWKQCVRQLKQEKQAMEFVKRTEEARLRNSFVRWMNAKALADCDRARALEVQRLLVHSQLHRVFLAWRLESMETRAVGPFTERREKRFLARVFDGWRYIVQRKKKGQDFSERQKNNIIARAFRYWRDQFRSSIKAKQEQATVEARLVQGCFQAWQRLHQRETTRRAVARQRETGCLRDAFLSWKAQMEEAELEREIVIGQEHRKTLLQKIFFQAWRKVSGEEADVENERCFRMQDKRTASTVRQTWKRWRRALDLELKVRSLVEKRGRCMLREAFCSWHRFTKQSMSAAIEEFEERLNESCISLQSQTLIGSLPSSLSSPSSSPSSSSSSLSLQLQHHCMSWPSASSPFPLQKLSNRLREKEFAVLDGGFDQPASVEDIASDVSDKATDSTSLLSQLQHHDVTSPSASPSPSPLRNLSTHLIERKSSITLTEGGTEQGIGFEDIANDASAIAADSTSTLCGECLSNSDSQDCITATPSPLRNLFQSVGDHREFASALLEVKGQLEPGEGLFVRRDQGMESSSGQSIDSQTSHYGISSIADSGCYANGLAILSNGECQVEAGSDISSVKSVKYNGTDEHVLGNPPHKNNNNNASGLAELHIAQSRDEWMGLSDLPCSLEDLHTRKKGEFSVLQGEASSPECLMQNGPDASPLDRLSSSQRNPSISASSKISHSHRQHDLNTSINISNSCDTGMTGGHIDQDLMSFPDGQDGRLDIQSGANDTVDGHDEADRFNESINSGSNVSEILLMPAVASTAQVGNQQAVTSIANKRAYLKSIIFRLRLWPASAAFYQWLEYTRIKKMHKQYRALVEGRMNDIELRAAFQLWRKHSSNNQLAHDYLNKRLLERHFRAWSSFKERQTKQEIQTARAEQHASHTLLEYAWRSWKEQFIRSLYPIGPRPSWSAHFSQSELMSQRCAVFQAKIQGKNVRKCLAFWRLRLRQLQEAEDYRKRVVIKRCLIAWSSWSRERRWREEAARRMLEKRQKRLALRHWRTQLSKLTLVHSHYHGAAHSHLCLIVREWRRWAETSRRLRLSLEQVVRLDDGRVLRGAWLAWKSEVEKSRRGRVFYNQKVLERTFSGWKATVHILKHRREIMSSIQTEHQHASVSSCFKHWKRQYNVRRLAERQRERQGRRVMTEVLEAWKMFVEEQLYERQRRMEILQETFSIWHRHYRATKRRKELAVSAALHWRHVVRRSHELTEIGELFQHSAKERKMEQAFFLWKRAFLCHQLAEQHRRKRLLFRSMQELKELLTTSQKLNIMEQKFVSRKRNTLMAVYFKKWKEKQSHMNTLHVRAAKFKDEVTRRSLAAAFLAWQRHCMERQTEHVYQKKLILKAWQTWKMLQANQRKADCVKEEKENKLLRQAFNALQTWARDHSGRRIVLQCVLSRKNHFTLKKTFAAWKHETRLRQLAKDHHRMCVQRKVLTNWHNFSDKKKILSALHHKFTSRLDTTKQIKAFKLWKATFIAVREMEAKLQTLISARETSLLARCFHDWRDHVREIKAQRFRERMMMRLVMGKWRSTMERRRLVRQYEKDLEELATLHWEQRMRQEYFSKWKAHFEAFRQERRHHYLEQKYGLIWKRRVIQALMAQAMARYWQLQRCWKAWRRCYIMEQVSQKILAQDKHILLAKIFKKWHQLTLHE